MPVWELAIAVLVHITPESEAKRIERGGIKPSPEWGRWPSGVYAMPVLANHFVSHQWLRELKRRGDRVFAAVRFRLTSQETVWVGHFRSDPVAMPAGEAIKIIMNAPDARGYQIVVPRKVLAKELLSVETVSKVLGWRYFPESKGEKPPTCDCLVCSPKGEIKGARLRRAQRLPKTP